MGRTLTLQGSVLRHLGQYADAKATYEQAIELLGRIGDYVHKAMAQMNLGNVYGALSQPAKALKCHLSAKRVFSQVKDRLHLAHVYHNLGMTYRSLQKWGQARNACQKSIDLWQELNDIERQVNTMDELAWVYFEQDDEIKAMKEIETALALLTDIRDKPGYEYKHKMLTTDLARMRDNTYGHSRGSEAGTP